MEKEERGEGEEEAGVTGGDGRWRWSHIRRWGHRNRPPRAEDREGSGVRANCCIRSFFVKKTSIISTDVVTNSPLRSNTTQTLIFQPHPQLQMSAAVDKVLGNDDLLTKILNFLPPKPLVRSKSVTKHWLNLISDHQFLINYSRRLRAIQPPSSFSLFYHNHSYYDTQCVASISLDGSLDAIPKWNFLETIGLTYTYSSCYPNLKILDSCNGLFLCKLCTGGPFIVFNPTTKKYKLLPEPLHGYRARSQMHLTFDPCVSFHYKVVHFRKPASFNCRDVCWHLSVFSSENWSWKEVILTIPQSLSRDVFWNGALNWIGNNYSHVRFYVDEEMCTRTRLPVDTSTPLDHGSVVFIGECDSGLLVIIKTQEINQNGALRIFEMSKDSNCWATKYRFDLKHLISEFPEIDSTTGKYRFELRHLTSDFYEMGEDSNCWASKYRFDRRHLGKFRYRVFYVKSETNKKSFSLVVGIPRKVILHSVSVDKECSNNFAATTRVVQYLTELHRSSYHPFIQCLAPI